MRRFEPYRGIMIQCRDEIRRRDGRSPSFERVMEAAVHAAALLNLGRDIVQSQSDEMTFLYELVHYSLSNQVVCLAPALADQIMASSNKASLSNLRLPFDIFELCLQEDFAAPGTGRPLPSALVAITPSPATLSALGGFHERVVAKAAAMTGRAPEGTARLSPEVADSVAVRFRTTARDGHPVMGNLTFRASQMDGKTIDEAIRELPLDQAFLATPFDEQENKDNQALLSAIMGTICYLNTASPDALRFLPEGRPKLGRNPQGLILGSLEAPGRKWHLRSGCFHVLRHERFHHNPDGSARTVWTRPAEVGKGCPPSAPDEKITPVPREDPLAQEAPC